MGKFERIDTGIEGLIVIKPTVFEDSRGFFLESYNKNDFIEIGITDEFVQDNHSKSSKGVLRGLHFQKEYAQGKLVRVISGEVFDVAVDIRKGSKTHGNWYGLLLSAENKMQFYIPKGFAHGFLVTTDTAEFVYKCTDFYHPGDEGGLLWNDSDLGIEWPLDKIGGIQNVLQSEKDQKWSTFKNWSEFN